MESIADPCKRLARLVQLILTFSVLASLVLLVSQKPAFAKDRKIVIDVAEGQTIRLPKPAATVFIAEPSIADIQTPSNETFFVFGKSPGTTSLFALDEEGVSIFSADIIVKRSTDVLQVLREQVGNFDFHISYTPNGAILSGVVPNAETAETARAIVAQYLSDGAELINRLKVVGKLQVNIQVKIAEVSRTITKELGFNWDAASEFGDFAFGLGTGRTAIDAAGGLIPSPTGAGSLFGSRNTASSSVSAVIDALAEDGLISILAEPNLTAASGQSANFLAGGEFPIPINQGDGQISVEFRRFGVSLNFVPTVLSDNTISIKVTPEVSELSTLGAIETDGFAIPSITTRRADTTVDIGSGESFAIAGLVSNNIQSSIQKFPGLGDIPVLGTLFRSTDFQREQTELVIIVTPYIVKPTPQTNRLDAPTDLIEAPTDLELLLFSSLTKTNKRRKALRLRGDAGFLPE
ncbi:MAG: type II and III secretion system protein family protein [Pseudomonadota bacterium]